MELANLAVLFALDECHAFSAVPIPYGPLGIKLAMVGASLLTRNAACESVSGEPVSGFALKPAVPSGIVASCLRLIPGS